MDDRTYTELTRGWKFEGPMLNDCYPVCVYNVLRRLSVDLSVQDLHIPYSVVRDEVALYHKTKGPSLAAVRPNLDGKVRPLGFVAREFKKPEMTQKRLLEVINDHNCSFPIIALRLEYFNEHKVNFRSEGDTEWDHAVVVLEVDSESQQMTIFDPMEKRLSMSSNIVRFRRRLPLSRMVAHWERARLDQRWAFWVERTKGQMKLKVD